MARERFDIHTHENFLSSDETETIRNKVWELKPDWRNALTYPQEELAQYKINHPELWEWGKNLIKNQNFLGDASYMLKHNLDKIDVVVQNKLDENFGWLYEKIISYFKEFYQTENVKLHSVLPRPGFHIFNNGQHDRLIYPYHTDKEQHPDDIPEENSVYSFLLLIQSIDDSPHLEYLTREKIKASGFEEKTYVSISVEGDKLPYELNNLYVWRGSMYHRIGAFALKDNEEARITFQGHIYFDKNDNFYKIYF